MSKKTAIWLGVAALAIGTPATYFALQSDTFGSAIEANGVKKVSPSEQMKILNRVQNMVSDSKKPSDIEEYLAKNVAKLNKSNANEAFYSFTYALVSEQERQMDAYQSVSNDLLFSYEDGEFKAGSDMNTSKVKDFAVKGYLDELKRQFLYLEDDGTNLNLKVDYERLNKKYESIFDNGLKTLMAVYIQDNDSPYLNPSMTQFDMKKMLERILFIEGQRENWENTMYHNEIQGFQERTYADFFGLTHESYFEKNGEKMVMKKSVQDEMWELLREYNNSFMGNDIVAYMDTVERNKWEKKDEAEVVLKMMSERFSSTSKVQAPFESITPPTSPTETEVIDDE